jgi:uncharacterized protein (DUF2147 family)
LSLRICGLLGILLAGAMPSGGSAAVVPEGVWLTEGRDAAVELTPCGSEPLVLLCGRIVWLQNATDESGLPRVDSLNPEAARRSRPVCGLMVMGGLRAAAANHWDSGSIYNPQDGRIYSADVMVLSSTTLRVRAYLGVPFFGEMQVWTRAERSAAGITEYNCRFVRVPPLQRR